MDKEEILNTFLLANSSEIITQEEFDDVKKAIFKMLKENKILKENSYHNDKVVDKVNWENQLLKKQIKTLDKTNKQLISKLDRYDAIVDERDELKKQLEAINEQANYLRKSVERKEETIIDLQNEKVPYTNEYVAKLEKEQKEFVKCLEDEIKRINPKELDIGELNLRLNDIKFTQYLIYKEILQKYKEIIGVVNNYVKDKR